MLHLARKAFHSAPPPISLLRVDSSKALQSELLENAMAGDVIEGTGALRKLRRHEPL